MTGKSPACYVDNLTLLLWIEYLRHILSFLLHQNPVLEYMGTATQERDRATNQILLYLFNPAVITADIN